MVVFKKETRLQKEMMLDSFKKKIIKKETTQAEADKCKGLQNYLNK